MNVDTYVILNMRLGGEIVVASIADDRQSSRFAVETIEYRVRQKLLPGARRLPIVVMIGKPKKFSFLYGPPKLVDYVQDLIAKFGPASWIPYPMVI